jgi:hypothetical protein
MLLFKYFADLIPFAIPGDGYLKPDRPRLICMGPKSFLMGMTVSNVPGARL